MAVFGCSVAATRPVQEMSNAEAAIRAAKDLNADTLSPELFRKASDYHFKAKREYRLKNFEEARKYALRAMKYAEDAEFHAMRGGGALPDASSLEFGEGASPDAEASFEEIPGEPSFPREQPEKPAASPAPSAEAPSDGTDYNVYMRNEEKKRQEELERAREKKNDEKATAPSAYSRGPSEPRLYARVSNQAQTPKPDYNPTLRSGSLPPAIGPSLGIKPTSTPKPDSSKPIIIYRDRLPEDTSEHYGEIKEFAPEEPKDLFSERSPAPSPTNSPNVEED